MAVKVAMAKVYVDDNNERHTDMAGALRANKEIAKRNLGRLLEGFDIYGIGTGYSDHQIDTNELVDRLVNNQDIIINLLKKARSNV